MNSVGLKLKVNVKSLRDLDLDLVAIIAIYPPIKTFLSRIKLKSEITIPYQTKPGGRR